MAEAYYAPADNLGAEVEPTALNAGISNSATSLVLKSGQGARFLSQFPLVVKIDGEWIAAGGRTGDTLTGLVRGLFGSLAASHDANAEVEGFLGAGLWNALVEYVRTYEISGSGTVEVFYALAEGEMVEIAVDHHGDAQYRWAEPPRFADAAGVIFLLDTSGTDGAGFRVWAMRSEAAGGGWSGGAAANLEYSWTRRGGLQ